MTLDKICEKAIQIKGISETETKIYFCSINYVKCKIYKEKEKCNIIKYFGKE